MPNTVNRRRVAALLCVVSLLFPSVAVRAESRPFAMFLQGNADPTFVDPCTITNVESGTGLGLHLGALTWISNEVVDLCAEGGPRVTAEFVLTAASGEQVFGRLNTLAHFDFPANRVTFAGSWEVDGGTGNFADATGEGQLSGSGSLSFPFAVIAVFAGEIDY